MASQLTGATKTVIGMYQALFGMAPSNALLTAYTAQATANPTEFAKSLASTFTFNDAMAATVLTNLKITATTVTAAGSYDALLAALKTAFAAPQYAGLQYQIVLNLANILSGLEADATYGAAAAAFNAQSLADFTYSSNVANTVPGTPTAGSGNTGNEAGASLVLTTGIDQLTGSAAADFFRGVAGKTEGNQDQSTLNSTDILDGGAGADTLIVNMTGGLYQGGARIKAIETLQIGTNLVNVATVFDYNVNAGFNEISSTLTVVADQINNLETLTINNVLKTDTDLDGTRETLPDLSWQNDSNTALAGVVQYNYRAAEVVGATTQDIELSNVHNGDLDIGGGVETFNVFSVGSQNTLRSETNPATGNDNADLSSGGSLTTVNITATTEFGSKAGILANGFTDRRVGSDEGIGADGSAADVNGTSNLVSVEDNVTTVNAADSTAAVNIRFVKDGAVGRNVVFTGGAGNDYVEFELGNINANGGAGEDTFSFINPDANSTLGESDTIVGGDGADTIQIGLNGALTYNVSETELRNKSSVGTLDLRGAITNLTLSSDFVSKADTADTINVFTNKIVQTSVTNAANGSSTTPLANFDTEDVSTHTVNLTMLSSNQTVNFVGGSGSDRIILSDATFNVLKNIDGGNYTEGVTGSNFAAGSTRFDTITLVTNGENVVIDNNDLSNVKDIEGFVLTKNSAAANYNITLTQAFVNNNTESINNLTNTGINDTVFSIGTARAANNSALAGAGDTVTIDVRDLLNTANTAKAAGFTRNIDVTSLVNAGVTLVFIGNDGAVVPNATVLALLQVADAVALADVIGASAAIPAGNIGVSYTSGIGAQATLGTNFNDTFTLSQGDTVTAGAGTDTVTFQNGGGAAQVTLGGATGTGADTVNLNSTTGPTGDITMSSGGTINVAADLGGSGVGYNFETNAVGNDWLFGAAPVTINISVDQVGGATTLPTTDGGSTVSTSVTTGRGDFTLGAGGQTFTGAAGASTAGYAVTDNAGSDTVTFTNANANTYNKVVGGGIDSVTFNAANGVQDTLSFSSAVAGAGSFGVVAGKTASCLTPIKPRLLPLPAPMPLCRTSLLRAQSLSTPLPTTCWNSTLTLVV